MPLIDPSVVDLSRAQFALTALYHFLFVPLTLGMTFLIAAMETVYVITGKEIYKEMTHFWAKLFGINFAIGVATGLTMEFEFGTNWSMYSHFVGDVFGTPLAIEGLMAFFMESTFIGLMFFGWNRLSRPAHLAVTYLTALGSNLSALWILIANGFMQNPQGAAFDPVTMRMQFNSFLNLVFSPDAQAKFVHTSIAGFVAGALFVMGVSSFYILRGVHKEFAARSFRMAALFGIVSSMAVVTLGDALGRLDYLVQPTKIAAIEGLWQDSNANSSAAASPWLLFALPNDATQSNVAEIGIPYVLTPLITHSESRVIPGLLTLEQQAGPRIDSGITAINALQQFGETHDPAALATFQQHEQDMGYGFLAQEFAPNQDLTQITPANHDAIIAQTEKATIPNVFVTFWAFRIMMYLGFYFVVLFAFAAYYSLRNELEKHPLVLKAALFSIPLPILACEFGWITAEAGRQPWSVYGWLPTFQAASSHPVGYMAFSLVGFALLYSCFIAAELYLMFKFGRLGPQHHEDHEPAGHAAPMFATGAADKSWQ
ncbi:cytochrome ubiquinol oxidase subunit I [Acidocella sp.]|uniref:cytochrome ubiquinol oxidase subunit I n=1 Tax=Acidocella sp. TaxID=50710 RepID=UPI0026232654|nr:cytochrome ubiquinol oxidase subunit I [Acidocella sp.]